VGRFSGAGDRELVGSEAAEPLLAEIFATPLLRRDDDPPPAPTWAVANPLPPPAELEEQPRILSPSPGATFLAVRGEAIVNPRVNHPAGAIGPGGAGLSWFLNGRLLHPGAAERLSLSPGAYELRCADDRGRSSADRFVVR
jgi:membrane carboxypeptidase/penicillin-binding protein PbpC